MAYSSDTLLAREVTDAAADKPMYALQVIPETPALTKWTESSNSGAGSDRTLSTKPARRAYDGLSQLAAQADTTASNEWYYHIDSGASDLMEFDCVFLVGHNFSGLAAVSLQIADDAAFAVNMITIATWAPTSNGRLSSLSLKSAGADALRYSDVRYARIKVNDAANFTPYIGEIILGRRFQQDRKPDRPFNPDLMIDSFAVTKTIGSVMFRANYATKQFALRGEWPIDDNDYIDEWIDFWSDCDGPFVFVYEPNSAPNDWAHMMLTQEELDFPIDQASTRMARIEAEEQGPEDYFFKRGVY